MADSRRLLIVYHSQTGGTRQMAHAVRDGALQAQALDVQCLQAHAATPAHVLQAHAYVFATPEYLGSMSGALKDFFDRCYYPVLDQIAGRPYMSLVCAGSDGQPTTQQIARIATGWRLKAAATPLVVCTHAQTSAAIASQKVIPQATLAQCKAMGEALAHGVAAGIF